MAYKFALDEMNTKINILKDEFNYIHDYNPIEHVKSRLKSPESILKKVYRKGHDFTLQSIKENVKDIAGIRITCSFSSDIYELYTMIANKRISGWLKQRTILKILNRMVTKVFISY